jgi:hypothetical protein
MCSSPGDCGNRASCVAGRCVAQGATAAIDSARRLLFAPVDAAYVRRDPGNAGDAEVGIATLGRAADGGGVGLLRFAAQLSPEATVLEAYLLLERATDVDTDPAPITLYAERIVEPWDGATVSWGRAPRVQEASAARTRVSLASGPLIRLELRALVQQWRRLGSREFGVAVLAEGTSATGMPLIWAPSQGSVERRDPVLGQSFVAAVEPASPFEAHSTAPASVGDPRAQLVGPRLELYVR